MKRIAPLLAVVGLLGAGCGGDDAPRGDPVAGEEAAERAEPSCDRCHTLAGAGWTGDIGPNLDDLRPGYGRVLEAVRTGPGLMPAYDGLPNRRQHDIAAFVSQAATESEP